jgi:8-oxo-dGTP pyrophosphatase MutT (NUDIX family)
MRQGPAAVEPRLAATLVLTRDCQGGGPPEVLLVERSAASDFVPGAYVFPGGGVDPEDGSAPAIQLSPHLGPEAARARLSDAPSALAALGCYVAALRETFEEAGLLLARLADGGPWRPTPEAMAALEGARAGLREGKLSFAQWVADSGLVLATEELIYFARWITPESVPKRFDTRFFVAPAPLGMGAAHDRREIVAHRWLTPAEALAEHAAGRIRMVEPTVKNLERLREFSSSAELRAGLRSAPVPCILPKLSVGAQGLRRFIYPWDPQYESH